MLFSFFLLLTLGLFTWLSIRHFHSALLLFLALFPTYLIRFSVGPLPTTLLEVLFLLLFGIWFIRRLRHHSLSAPSKKILVLFILLSVTSLIVVPAEHLLSSVGLWRAYLLEPLLLGWLLWHEFQDTSLRVRAFLSLSLSAFTIAALGIFQFSSGLGIPAPWDIERRITSVFDYPNALGLFLAPVLSALLVFGISTWKERLSHEKKFVVGASGIMLLAIVLAKTEAALVAIPAALLLAFLVSPLPSRKQKIAAFVLAGVALTGALAFTPVREKILLQDFSGSVRLSQWKETIELLKDHPITGAG
ncbi:O-antigen ligase domain-containing protein, partial [bacterium]|nr:O-antigen ligase domain-containing protein [bacterium]